MQTLNRTPLNDPTHIYLDVKGVAWIDDTNTKVIEVVIDNTALGMQPEEIHNMHPDVSMAQIHAALAYYHDHKDELDAEIARRADKATRLQSAVRGRLTRADLEERLQHGAQ